MNKLLREPVVHFFIAGAFLFLAHRLFTGAPGTITVTHGVRNDLSRRFQDTYGREPDAAELDGEIRKWEIDEVLSREAVRDRLDRDDPGIRTILADKMRLRAAFEAPKREPTDAELDAWLAAHRDRYEMPPRYDFEFVAFPKTEVRAEAERDAFARAVESGKPPASLGRPVIGGDLTAGDLKGRVEPALASRITALPPGGPWQRVETEQSFVLARLKGVSGPPTRQQLGERLVEDWKRDLQQQAVDRAVQRLSERYHIVVEP